MNAETSSWRTSSYSGPQGNCVEVGWRTASYSGTQGNCLETAVSPGVTAVRDTKDRDGGTLTFDRRAWSGFLTALKADRYA